MHQKKTLKVARIYSLHGGKQNCKAGVWMDFTELQIKTWKAKKKLPKNS